MGEEYINQGWDIIRDEAGLAEMEEENDEEYEEVMITLADGTVLFSM